MRDVAVEGDKKGCVTIAIWLVDIRVFLDQKFDYVVQSPLYGESETRLVDLRTTLQNFRYFVADGASVFRQAVSALSRGPRHSA